MENSVYVVGDENGGVITLSKNNQEYGWLTLRQDRMRISNGWAQNKALSTIIMGKTTDLESLNLASGEILDGQIIVREQLKPFSTEDRDLKVAGSTGIVCSVNGKPIYRKTFYTTDMTLTDVEIQHDNGDAIRAANATEASNRTVEPVQELEAAFEL